jgi:SAM-dependent methyltransferase/RimJ/RimL family protein N-acetyltransferase
VIDLDQGWRTERLDLEPLTADHAAELAPVLDDAALHEFIGGAPLPARALAQRYARLAARRSPDGEQLWGNWVMRVRETGLAVGTMQVTMPAGGPAAGPAEVAWVVGLLAQGRGYAKEAACGLVALLREAGWTIAAHIHPAHLASQRVASTAGLSPTQEVQDGEIRWVISSERSGTLAEDPFDGRPPTSHERMTGEPWDASYRDGPAPWDTGRPQPAVVRLASEGRFAGAVLDAGCGTGEDALHVASLGLPVLGFDVAETALAVAQAKAGDRGIEAEFAAADALQLERLGRTFETVLDCGLFHTFDGDERPAYVASLASVTGHGGTLYVLCFSDDGPGTGPHPVSQAELRAAFTPVTGWNVTAIESARVQTNYHDDDGAPAWLATIKRI